MIQTLKLLLPALIPSWNFFDVIADSPRIEYSLLGTAEDGDSAWLEFRPRPERIPFPAMVGRLFWNAQWNETLFLISCAERLMETPTEHSQNEIFRRIAADLTEGPGAAWLRFRIALLSEREGAIEREIAFISEARPVASLSLP
jgi:hypothetical protein